MQIKAIKNTPLLIVFCVKFFEKQENFNNGGDFYLEPYALFDFLQSILASTSTEKKNESTAETATQKPEKLEKIEKTEKIEEQQTPPKQEQNTAFLQFMQAHETRAKRTKKQ